LRFQREGLILAFVPINAKSSRPFSETTPQERLERLVQLQRQAWELLIASPNGYEHFWKRNLRQRRIHARH
jgi:hypothetical protein